MNRAQDASVRVVDSQFTKVLSVVSVHNPGGTAEVGRREQPQSVRNRIKCLLETILSDQDVPSSERLLEHREKTAGGGNQRSLEVEENLESPHVLGV
jgi:hypothetical protein